MSARHGLRQDGSRNVVYGMCVFCFCMGCTYLVASTDCSAWFHAIIDLYPRLVHDRTSTHGSLGFLMLSRCNSLPRDREIGKTCQSRCTSVESLYTDKPIGRKWITQTGGCLAQRLHPANDLLFVASTIACLSAALLAAALTRYKYKYLRVHTHIAPALRTAAWPDVDVFPQLDPGAAGQPEAS
jgi:hypothetical protein